ncbi:Undecaprenyl phosphate N,N'-diacetylbacillosamine 1-phosphate transferase [Granulosicoccus antarcticus IMCC3135]|uniref:Undecaprenyl phosphate N,N'-diacetylbacillosamine 1-phosphate transferase n=2 Tax=Granulosicoccus TaxID=437504 RepID=A0A2Z2NTG3_9GAMM|nr:Undecaprenyl phosphate N,N'-diacetylbacillosamine 1-phosphate transferase [Granulosicoccus antarcticus IMCC3135]
MYRIFKRLFDLVVAFLVLVFLLFPMLIVAVAIKATSRGSVLYWSKRVGENGKFFYMPKFRTMHVGTPEVATDILKDASAHVTWCGHYLRKYSIDELPQLYSILKGDMSFVGPRPALHNQISLIELRDDKNVSHLIPGLTGLAQISGRDTLSDEAKVELDSDYQKSASMLNDVKIILATIRKTVAMENVSH